MSYVSISITLVTQISFVGQNIHTSWEIGGAPMMFQYSTWYDIAV